MYPFFFSKFLYIFNGIVLIYGLGPQLKVSIMETKEHWYRI